MTPQWYALGLHQLRQVGNQADIEPQIIGLADRFFCEWPQGDRYILAVPIDDDLETDRKSVCARRAGH